jgi:hypothetical protein
MNEFDFDHKIMSEEYKSVLISTDTINRKLVDLMMLDFAALVEFVHDIEDLEELRWTRNHLLASLEMCARQLLEDISELRARACPVVPEIQRREDGTISRIWRQPPNKWSQVLPDDVQEIL